MSPSKVKRLIWIFFVRPLWYDHASVWTRPKSGSQGIHAIRRNAFLLLLFGHSQSFVFGSRIRCGTEFFLFFSRYFCLYERAWTSLHFNSKKLKSYWVMLFVYQLELDYCCIKSVNRRNGKSLRRVWVHGKFQKPV